MKKKWKECRIIVSKEWCARKTKFQEDQRAQSCRLGEFASSQIASESFEQTLFCVRVRKVNKRAYGTCEHFVTSRWKDTRNVTAKNCISILPTLFFISFSMFNYFLHIFYFTFRFTVGFNSSSFFHNVSFNSFIYCYWFDWLWYKLLGSWKLKRE